jgi:hypothetical protein
MLSLQRSNHLGELEYPTRPTARPRRTDVGNGRVRSTSGQAPASGVDGRLRAAGEMRLTLSSGRIARASAISAGARPSARSTSATMSHGRWSRKSSMA